MAIAEKELKAFMYAVEHNHFQKASERAHMTSSALSRLIQRLEERVGAPLFYRSKRKMSLSPAGEQFYLYAQRALQNWDELNVQLQQGQIELKGWLSLYCSVTAAYSILTQLLPLFRRRYPNIEVQLRTGDAARACERVLGGQEQLAICAKPKRLNNKLLYKEVASSPLLLIIPKIDCVVRQQWQKNKNAWKNLPWIVPETGVLRACFESWAKRQQYKPQIYNEVSGHEAIVSMVALGFGIGIVPQIVLEHSPQKSNIEISKRDLNIDAFSIGVCVQKYELKNPLVQAFWALIDE